MNLLEQVVTVVYRALSVVGVRWRATRRRITPAAWGLSPVTFEPLELRLHIQ